MERISTEMVFRGLYHFSNRFLCDEADDVVNYLTLRYKLLRLVKSRRKRHQDIDAYIIIKMKRYYTLTQKFFLFFRAIAKPATNTVPIRLPGSGIEVSSIGTLILKFTKRALFMTKDVTVGEPGISD